MDDGSGWNVGRVDEGIRVALVAAIVVTGAWLLTVLDANWTLFVLLGGGLGVAYLLLTSAAHGDPVYAILGIDTRHPRRAR